MEVVQFLESNSSTLDSDDVDLVWQILPGMVDDQPLPESIPTPDRMPHNSSQPGSILGIAITVLLEVANTRPTSASTQT